jgi:hypothetical protein
MEIHGSVVAIDRTSVLDAIDRVTVGINGTGIHFLNENTVVMTWNHADIVVNGASHRTPLILSLHHQAAQVHATFLGQCPQAPEMRQLLNDYAVYLRTNETLVHGSERSPFMG